MTLNSVGDCPEDTTCILNFSLKGGGGACAPPALAPLHHHPPPSIYGPDTCLHGLGMEDKHGYMYSFCHMLHESAIIKVYSKQGEV